MSLSDSTSVSSSQSSTIAGLTLAATSSSATASSSSINNNNDEAKRMTPMAITTNLPSPAAYSNNTAMFPTSPLSPYKLIEPPQESDFDPWSRHQQKSDLMNALWEAVQDEELFDVFLVSSDGDEIPASRFVLAARSPVLKRMLYGSFREAKSSTICMMGYERTVLQAVVQYCQTSKLPTLNSTSDNGSDLECRVRQLVRLDHAADFLELCGLGELVHLEVRRLVGLYPGLACVVFDEVDDTMSRIGEYAKLMMELRPYESLSNGMLQLNDKLGEDGSNEHDNSQRRDSAPIDLDECVDGNMGGAVYLRAERLKLILQSQNIMCGELFLFRVLRFWYDQKSSMLADHFADSSADHEKENSSLLAAAVDCAKCLSMENIEPESLLKVVQHCPFINPAFLFDAFARQALRASQNRVWTLHSRPAKYQGHERVLVEDCGCLQARGMYVRMVSGLKKGTLYTKREVASGQAIVYTLSCSVKEGHVECRIFSSPLLTPMAVTTLCQHIGTADTSFQPILQVVAVKKDSTKNSIVVSDGQYCMQATLANSLNVKKPVLLYGVIQVISFRVYNAAKNGDTKIHIQRASIVNSNAGQMFGRPRFYASKETKSQSLVVAGTNAGDDDQLFDDDTATLAESVAFTTSSVSPSIDECSTFAANHHAAVKDPEHVTKLYSCTYPLKKQGDDPLNSRVPQDGWKLENEDSLHLNPPPTCTWFPAVKAGSNSTKQSSSLVLKSPSSALLSPSKSKSKGRPPIHRKSSNRSSLSVVSNGSDTSSNSGVPLQVSQLESLLKGVNRSEAAYSEDEGDGNSAGIFVDDDSADLNNEDNFTAVSALSSIQGN